MTRRELEALAEAANSPGRWGLFKQVTTRKLAEKGFFQKEQHPVYGRQFRLTQAGLDAWEAAEKAS